MTENRRAISSSERCFSSCRFRFALTGLSGLSGVVSDVGNERLRSQNRPDLLSTGQGFEFRCSNSGVEFQSALPDESPGDPLKVRHQCDYSRRSRRLERELPYQQIRRDFMRRTFLLSSLLSSLMAMALTVPAVQADDKDKHRKEWKKNAERRSATQ